MSIAAQYDALVGKTFGEFVLRERIGEGGFGAVYRASQPALDREAVVKLLHPRLLSAKTATERFLREARLASKLDHPYAAHIYAFGVAPDGELWIAMELVRGTPLDQILKIQGPLPLERFVGLLDRICEVVHTAHEQGIVHRDIKPANVMVLSRSGRLLPKLLDLGIAKGLSKGQPEEESETAPPIVDPSGGFANTIAPTSPTSPTPLPRAGTGSDHVALTQRGAVMGSPHYMAPEQWLDAKDVDARADLYALAIVAFEALTGKPPFTGTTINALANAHANKQPPPLGAAFPSALDAVIRKALAKQPAERYPDALAFAAAFRKAAGVEREVVTLPPLDKAMRDTALAEAPQPIAEAIAAIEAARNPHQARDAYGTFARTVVRYLGLLALACRSRITSASESILVGELLRTLHRRALTDAEWLELAREATGEWRDRRDAYPVPELVDAFQDAALAEQLLALAARTDATTDDALLALLEGHAARVALVLAAIDFIRDYTLAITLVGGIAETWMGVRRPQRSTTMVRGELQDSGIPLLLDKDGVPVLSLAPLFQVTAPTPGAPPDLFLFDGRDARGAKLVAMPSGFEHHDEAFWDWFRAQLRGSLEVADEVASEEKAPYRGLSAFSSDDAAMFVGREKLVDAFVNRLRVQSLLAVVGRSGAGKSSFVHAGVVPALPAEWRVLAMRPGASPIAALAARLAHANIASSDLRTRLSESPDALGELLRTDAATRGPLLLVVDQFEELFTLCDDDNERHAFADAVAAASRGPEDPVRVVLTLRDDFLLRAEQVPSLRSRLGQGLQLLSVPAVDDLRRILVEPARRAGYELEDTELPLEIVREVADQPGALALISFTASKLWELRDRHFKQLTRKAYRALGGVGGALAKHAEQVLDGMTAEERKLTRDAFRHLVTTQNTRAVIARDELRQLLGKSDHADTVVEKLVAARLLVASENEAGNETVEIVHEALLVAWPRLVEWRREDVDGVRFHEQLRAAAKQWQDRNRPQGLLWRDDALADYTRWRRVHARPLAEIEEAFAKASLDAAARSGRRRKIVLATAIAIVAIGVVALIISNARTAKQRTRAEANEAQAKSAAADLSANLLAQYEDQGRRRVLANEPMQGLVYLAKAAELGASGRAHDFLVATAARALASRRAQLRHESSVFRALDLSPSLLLTSSGTHAYIWDLASGQILRDLPHAASVTYVETSSDGATLVTASTDGIVKIWDRNGAPRAQLARKGRLHAALLTPDARTVATVAADDTVELWDVANGRLRTTLQSVPGIASPWFLSPASLTLDGSRLVVGAGDGVIRVWDVASGQTLATNRDHRARIIALVISEDGRRILVGDQDGYASIIELATGKRLLSMKHDQAIIVVRWSPDEKQVVTGGDGHVTTIWNAETGARMHDLTGHMARIQGAVFSRDGSQLVTTSEDGLAILWDPSSGRRLTTLLGHESRINDVRFTRDGKYLITAGHDNDVIVWDPTRSVSSLRVPGHPVAVGSVDFLADGRRVLSSDEDGGIRIWDRATGQLERAWKAESPVARAIASPDGTQIAATCDDKLVRLYDTNGVLQRSLAGHTNSVWDVAWIDNRRLATVSRDGSARVWSTEGALLEFRAHVPKELYSIAIGPGELAVTAGADQATRVWEVSTGIERYRWTDSRVVTTASFDPTGTLIAGGSPQGGRIWRLDGTVVSELSGHRGSIIQLRWSPDGAFVATAATDGTARIWDARRGEVLAVFDHAVAGHPVELWSLAFARDGHSIAAGASDGSVTIWNLPEAARDLRAIARCLPFQLVENRLLAIAPPKDCYARLQ